MPLDISADTLPLSSIASRRVTARFKLWPFLDRILQPTLAIALFLIAWEAAPRLGLVNPTFLPPFSAVIVSGFDYAWSGKLGPQILVSVERAAGGFFLGVVTGVPLGLLLGWFGRFERYLNPLLQLLRQTNPVSLFPVFILFFGIGYMTKVAIIYWVVVWPILLSTMAGVQYVDAALIRYARTLGFSHTQLFVKIVLPSAVPSIITGMRLAATYSYLMLVVSEMVGANSGLGYMVVNAQYLLSINLLYVGVIVLALLGIVTNYALVALERRLTAWKGEAVR
jgi:NitT/TauT family transport system permease protein